ncbi:MAG TPA: flippase-like domain-containing protein [Thermoplasmata archaeon]|nr:flippase-like domain-containing protein [Thermoplasmata archaeon]
MRGKNVKSRNIKLLVLSLSFSLVVITAVLFFTVDENTLSYLAKIQPHFFLLAIALQFFAWFLWGVRISLMARMVEPEKKVNLQESFSIVIANLFLAAVTPSMAGGEPVRIHLLSKKGFTTGCATAVVLGERVFDAVFILAMVPFALTVFQSFIATKEIGIGLTVGVILFIAGIILFFYTVTRPEKIKGFLSRIFKKPGEKRVGLLKRIEGAVDEFHRGSKLIFKTRNSKDIIAIFLITASSWLIGFLVPSSILLGLGHNPVFIQSIAAQVLLLIIVMIPITPGSSGVAELGASALYSSFTNISLLGVFIVLWRFITYYMNIIISSVFQYKLLKPFFKS